MATVAKRKGKQRRAAPDGEESEKLTKDEEAVAKCLLWGLPSREGVLVDMRLKVRIFYAEEAVEHLMRSSFATKPAKGSSAPLLKDTKAAVEMLGVLMEKGLFHRAAKLQKKEKRIKKRKTDASEEEEKAKEEKKEEKTKEKEEKTKEKEEKTKEKEEKRRRSRPRLEVHETQAFVQQAGEVYIWQYDPTRPRNVALGALLVLGSICLCLFPMWPSELRVGTYYLSVGLLCLLGGLFGLALVRYPLFAGVWLLTLGRLHFWLLPNLTEDAGVLESFVPVFSVHRPQEAQAAAKKSN